MEEQKQEQANKYKKIIGVLVIFTLLLIIPPALLFVSEMRTREKTAEKNAKERPSPEEKRKKAAEVDKKTVDSLSDFVFYLMPETGMSDDFYFFEKDRKNTEIDNFQLLSKSIFNLKESDFKEFPQEEGTYILESDVLESAVKKTFGPEVKFEIVRGQNYYGKLAKYSKDILAYVNLTYLPDISKFIFRPGGIGAIWCGPSKIFMNYDRVKKSANDVSLIFKVMYTDNEGHNCEDANKYGVYSDFARKNKISEITYEVDHVENSEKTVTQMVSENKDKAGEISFTFTSDGTGGYYFSESKIIK